MKKKKKKLKNNFKNTDILIVTLIDHWSKR